MKIGLQIPDFTWPGGAAELGPRLTDIVRAADQGGFEYIALMDHFFQIGPVGPIENDMLEAYTALGYIAAHTERATLLTLVTGVIYRHPGILAKIITTLDVLSGGRAMLGVGAGWNEEESRGLGIPFASTRQRFEELEDALKLALRMWQGDASAFEGTHVHAERPLNVPQSLTRPHPPIMIGGGGEQKTLRFVARYAQACNLFAGPDLARKLDVLREHCEREGRDYNDIEKTVYYIFDPGDQGEQADKVIDDLKGLADLGVDTAIGQVRDVWKISPVQAIAERVIPAVAEF
ncbi:MAG TPA: LLM class F420-dependent oxidoreductase [Pseudonocardiaceae bacterium]|jgi:F420-dependent oxidoreductase-like protein|nr:LLM class F420-dependent oxidoreductase [Pseudonocardiaceae bacterium]